MQDSEADLRLSSHTEKHFVEQQRRESLLLAVREKMLDNTEKMRIMEELYEWFIVTKNYMVRSCLVAEVLAISSMFVPMLDFKFKKQIYF